MPQSDRSAPRHADAVGMRGDRRRRADIRVGHVCSSVHDRDPESERIWSELERAAPHRLDHRHALIARIRTEYEEMPGLRLTLAQAMRLWQIDRATCTALLEQLVVDGFLQRSVTHDDARSLYAISSKRTRDS